jgi:hypothetical protein
MKKGNTHVLGIIAIISLLAAMVCCYLWGILGTEEYQALAYILLLFGACFTFAIARCISIIECRGIEKNESEAADYENLSIK